MLAWHRGWWAPHRLGDSDPFVAHTAPVLLVCLCLPVLTAAGLVAALAQCLPSARLSADGSAALGAGVLLVYMGERLLEPGRVPKDLHGVLWVAMACACVALLGALLWEPVRLLSIEIPLGIASLAYGLSKRVPAAKTIAVAGAWWIGCTLLPFEWPGEGPGWLGLLFSRPAISVALLIAAGAIMCDYKDEVADRRAGVRSAPLVLGRRRTVFLTTALAAVAAGLSWSAGGSALCLSAVAMTVLSPGAGLLARPLLGPALVELALALPGLVLLVH